MLTKPIYCETLSKSDLTLAYEMQLDAIKAQVKYETLEPSQESRIKQLENENTRQWWLIIALAVSLGYAAGN